MLLLTAALTGLRASELRGLRWSDIDLKAGDLQVRQRADRYNAIGAPKSDSSVRTIPIDPGALTAALREWKLACPKGEEGLVFPSSAGRIDHHKNMLRSLAPVMVAAGVVDKNGKPKYSLPAFLCKLVHKSKKQRRARTVAQSRAGFARTFVNQYDARCLWTPIPERRRQE